MTAGFGFVRLITHPRAELNGPAFAERTERFAAWPAVVISASTSLIARMIRNPPELALELHPRIAARTPVDPLPGEPVQGTLVLPARRCAGLHSALVCKHNAAVSASRGARATDIDLMTSISRVHKDFV